MAGPLGASWLGPDGDRLPYLADWNDNTLNKVASHLPCCVHVHALSHFSAESGMISRPSIHRWCLVREGNVVFGRQLFDCRVGVMTPNRTSSKLASCSPSCRSGTASTVINCAPLLKSFWQRISPLLLMQCLKSPRRTTWVSYWLVAGVCDVGLLLALSSVQNPSCHTPLT